MKYSNLLINPATSEWEALLKSFMNGALPPAVTEIRKNLQHAVRRSAEQFTTMLCDLSESRLGQPRTVAPLDSSAPIIALGHQPIIYHPGILAKNVVASTFAKESSATAINFILDLDEGDPGRLLYPMATRSGPHMAELHLGTLGGLYRDSVLPTTNVLQETFQHVLDGDGEDFVQLRENSHQAFQYYVNLEGLPTWLANTLVRKVLSDEQVFTFELPLSDLLALEEYHMMLDFLLQEPAALAERYNASLERFRAERKIKNLANPFPNLERAGAQIDLPFWVIGSEGSRSILRYDAERASFLLPDGTSFVTLSSEIASCIAPRGAFVSLIFRLFCCDLFVHGMGGERYDKFTEQFARDFFHTPIAPFVVVSATESLFPDKLQRLKKTQEGIALLKEVASHVDRFLGKEHFPSTVEKQLRQLADAQQHLIERVLAAERTEKSTISAELNAVKARIREQVEGSLGAQLRRELEMLEGGATVYSCREFPFFFFP